MAFTHALLSFTETLRIAATKDIAILVARGIGNFPNNEDRMTETIDVWWIVRILETGEQMDMFTEPQALTSGILVQQRLEIGVENLQKKWNIEYNKYYYCIYIIHKCIIDIY